MDQSSTVVNCNVNAGSSPIEEGAPTAEVMPESSADEQAPKTDPFSIVNGHYVGHDGFVVPRDFEEFYQRYPNHVSKWVRKHADRFSTKEDIEDWANDLLVHMMCLPENSKYRQLGKVDRVQTFDPEKHYGANEARFWNYINLCLKNRFSTMRSTRLNDALSQPCNLSLGVQTEEEESGSVSDEYCHSYSTHLRDAAKTADNQAWNRTRLGEFEHFLWQHAPKLLPVLRAIKATRSHTEAAASLEMTESEFRRMLYRLVWLGRHFVSGEPLPKQRKSYKRRSESLSVRTGGLKT